MGSWHTCCRSFYKHNALILKGRGRVSVWRLNIEWKRIDIGLNVLIVFARCKLEKLHFTASIKKYVRSTDNSTGGFWKVFQSNGLRYSRRSVKKGFLIVSFLQIEEKLIISKAKRVFYEMSTELYGIGFIIYGFKICMKSSAWYCFWSKSTGLLVCSAGIGFYTSSGELM